MLAILIVVLLILWLIGAFVVPVGSSLIHLLLVIALVVIIVRIARGQPL